MYEHPAPLAAHRDGDGLHPAGAIGLAVAGHIPVSDSAQQAARACVSKVGATYHELVTYQPASHYWPLQWIETALYFALAAGFCALCTWQIRRRNP